jgi:hypothetical protein
MSRTLNRQHVYCKVVQCIDIEERDQPVELEIFWTSPTCSLGSYRLKSNHHIAEGRRTYVLTDDLLHESDTPVSGCHDHRHQIGCDVLTACWCDERKNSSGRSRKKI